MTPSRLDQIVNAVLYEGYILYPYRATSKKNSRERFTFGRVYPKGYSEWQGGAEPCVQQTECLLQTQGGAPSLEVKVRFLHPMWREVGYLTPAEGPGAQSANLSFQAVPELSVDAIRHQSWQEATEREISVTLGELDSRKSHRANSLFSFPSCRACESLHSESAESGAAMMRRQEALEGEVEVQATPISADTYLITVRVTNRTPIAEGQCNDSDAVIMRTFASTHTILRATGGVFISLLEPPAEFEQHAERCKNIGTWPVLVGDERQCERDTMLSSPIILYDYPQVAPESAGTFFDGTEIDEMLTLRVMTMTEGEKLEMRQIDECARRILERAEATGPEDLMRMHGTMREIKTAEDFFNPVKPINTVFKSGRELKAGDRVRIHPKRRADAIDMLLSGKIAIIEAIEQDAEDQIHLALVLEDDPGKDLGLARQPGHRFFYSLEEVEPYRETPA